MSRFVFILGAGASFEAGAPVMKDFLDVAEDLMHDPIVCELSKDVDYLKFKLVFKALARMKPALANTVVDLRNLESVYNAFEMVALVGSLPGLKQDEVAQLPDAMVAVIRRTLEARIVYPLKTNDPTTSFTTVEPPGPYAEFARLIQSLLKAGHYVTIVTFNYDYALDFALKCARIPVEIPGRQPPSEQETPSDGMPRVPYLKLHGSLNWYTTDGKGFTVEELDPSRNATDLPKEWLLSGRSEIRLMFASQRDGGKVQEQGRTFIVPPSLGKLQEQGKLSGLWARAATELREAEHIVVFGYSLPPTDQFFRYLMALGMLGDARIREFLVVDPFADDELERRYREFLGPLALDRFSVLRLAFGEAALLPRNVVGLLDPDPAKCAELEKWVATSRGWGC